TVRRPDGSVLVNAGYVFDEFLPETAVAIADATGVFSVEVRASDTASPPGRYRILLETLRPAVADDAVRVDAERTYARGREIEAPGVLTDYPKSVEAFKAARDLY